MATIDIRPYQSDDLHPVHALIAEATRVDGTPHVTHAELRAIADPERTTAVALLRDDGSAAEARIVGAARWDGADQQGAILNGWVHPAFRGQGVGSALVEHAITTAKATGASEMTTRIYQDVPNGLSLFTTNGFVEERRFLAMWRDLDDSLLDPPQPPPGVTICPYQPETDAQAVYEADSEAFNTAWRVQSQSFDLWQTRMASHDDPALWAIAWMGERVAGVCISRRSDYGSKPNDGWIGHLGVRSDYRGLGIGRFLLYEAFSRLRRARFDRAGLHVDSLNTPARALYESAGLVIKRERLHMVRDLRR